MEEYRRNYQTDIIVVGWNNCELTNKCLESLRANTAPGTFRVTYVDNASDDQPLEYYVLKPFLQWADFQMVRLPFNHGFIRGCNIGLGMALLSPAEYVLILNNDAWLTDPHWLTRLIEVSNELPNVGAVGAVSDNVFGYQRRLFAGGKTVKTVSTLIGFCELIKKEAIEKVGLLDERFEPGNYEDFDYSLRLRRAGYVLLIAEDVFVHHKMHASFGKKYDFGQLLAANLRKLVEKWGREELNKWQMGV